jgi:hypothetical protein
MPLAIAGNRTIYFAHVPKAGGTSVELYLQRRFGPLSLRPLTRTGRESDFHRGAFSSVMNTPNHLVAQDARHFLPRRVDLAFVLVRDPLARIASEFRFQRPHSRIAAMGFSTWLRVMLRAVALDPRIYDNHIRPQVDFLTEGMEAFRLEDGLGRIVGWLDERLGETAPETEMTHAQKSASIPVAPTREDVALVARVFAADYARFGYAPPDPAAYPADRLARLRDLAARPLARVVLWRHWRRWLR